MLSPPNRVSLNFPFKILPRHPQSVVFLEVVGPCWPLSPQSQAVLCFGLWELVHDPPNPSGLCRRERGAVLCGAHCRDQLPATLEGAERGVLHPRAHPIHLEYIDAGHGGGTAPRQPLRRILWGGLGWCLDGSSEYQDSV